MKAEEDILHGQFTDQDARLSNAGSLQSLIHPPGGQTGLGHQAQVIPGQAHPAHTRHLLQHGQGG